VATTIGATSTVAHPIPPETPGAAPAAADAGDRDVLLLEGPRSRWSELQLVLEEFSTPPVPIHIVHRDARQGSARVRSFVDLMAARLRAEPGLHPRGAAHKSSA